MTRAEIRRLVLAFSELGLWKVRVTGGEPTLRADVLSIVEDLVETPGVGSVVMSTNGYRLRALAKPLRDAGLSGINVSVDSLDPKTFHEITGHDKLNEVLAGVEACLVAGIPKVKINAVILPQTDLGSFQKWIEDHPVSVRFIEAMETKDNSPFFRRVSAASIQEKLLRTGWVQKEREIGSGPAIEFSHPDFLGTIGLIAPYSPNFCSTCNRLRVTAKGELGLCLFGSTTYPLRQWLECDSQKESLKNHIRLLLLNKTAGHNLALGDYGSTRNFAAVGG